MSRFSRSMSGLVAAHYGGWGGLVRATWLPAILVGGLAWSVLGTIVQDTQYQYLNDRIATLEKGVAAPAGQANATGTSITAMVKAGPSFDPAAPLRPPSAKATIARHYGWGLDKRSGLWSFHRDVEFDLPPDVEGVVADQPGRITSVKASPDGTVSLTVEHAEGFLSEYSQLKQVSVSEGTQVRSGQLLGKCHRITLRLTRGGQVVNPETDVAWAPKLEQ